MFTVKELRDWLADMEPDVVLDLEQEHVRPYDTDLYLRTVGIKDKKEFYLTEWSED